MNQKIIIIAAAILIIIGGIYFLQNNYDNVNPPENGQNFVVPQDSNQVSVKDFAFSPNELNINKGDTVVWTNNDSVLHDVSGSDFRSSLLSNGQSFSFTFSEEGTFDYICAIHPSMKGRIVVK